MSKPLLLASTLAAAAGATLLCPGRAAADVPAFCAALDPNDLPSYSTLANASSPDPQTALPALIGMSCDRRTRPEEQAQVAALRATWEKRIGLAEDDWRDVADWTQWPPSSRGDLELHVAPDLAWSTLSPVDQFAAISFAFVNGHEALYVADALGDKLTQSGRLAVVSRCLRHKSPVEWAMCAGDVAALDVSKLGAELHANGGKTDPRRVNVRIIGLAVAHELAAHADEVKAAIAAEPAYGTMFEIAAKTRAEWDARATADTDLRALALAMDDARVTKSRRAMAGCGEKTMAAWRAAVGRVPATAFSDLPKLEYQNENWSAADQARGSLSTRVMTVLIRTPETYLATAARAMCKEAPPLPDVDLFVRWPGFRGPRLATLTALLAAGLQLDRADARIEWPAVSHAWAEHAPSEPRDGGDARGQLAAVKAHGDSVDLEFVHKPGVSEMCDAYVTSNKIDHIASDRTFVYQGHCAKSHEFPVDRRAPTTTLTAAAAAGLKAGMFVDIRHGEVEAAWASPKAPAPAIVFGVAVK